MIRLPVLFAFLVLAACSQLARRDPLRRFDVEDRGYDALHYDLHLDLRPDQRGFEGRTRIRLRATRPLAAAVFDAVELGVRSVSRDGRPVGGWREAEGQLTVAVDPVLAPGEEAVIDVAYAAFPRAGLHFALPGCSGLDHPPQVWTQGEAEHARRWFPCNDQPADRASHSLTATVPADWITVAAGERRQRTVNEAEGTATVTWALEQEVPCYLFTFAAGPFEIVKDRWEDVEIWYVCEAADRARARASLADTPAVLRFFSEYTGFRYPFRKYATVAVREHPYGGMENVTATTITRSALQPPERLPEGSARELVAHEAAHQWFGDVVTCRTWADAWLNEGFATAFTHLFLRAEEGQAAYERAAGEAVDAYTAACRGPGLRAIVKEEAPAALDLFFDGTIYPGGAMRLHLLRGWLGEEAFRSGIRAWLTGRAFQSASTTDFRQAMEAATGENLAGFFEQWVRAPGYPELVIGWDETGGTLRVRVQQVQDASRGVPAAFVLPLDLRWNAGGRLHTVRRWVRAREERFELPAGGPVAFLEADPGVILPATLELRETPDATRARLLGASSARSRILAARSLAGDPASREELWEAATGDRFWGVRTAAVQALAALAAPADLPALRDAWAAETRPEVRAGWLALVAAHPGEDAAQALLEEIAADPARGPGERAAALRGVLARPAPVDPIALLLPAPLSLFASAPHQRRLRRTLEDYLAEPDPGLLFRAAVVEGMAQRLPSGRTSRLLARLSGPGHAEELRVLALQNLRPFLGDQRIGAEVRAVRAALSDPSTPVRAAAAEVAGRVPEVFASDLRRRLAVEPFVRVRRALEAGLPRWR